MLGLSHYEHIMENFSSDIKYADIKYNTEGNALFFVDQVRDLGVL